MESVREIEKTVLGYQGYCYDIGAIWLVALLVSGLSMTKESLSQSTNHDRPSTN